MGAVLYLGHMIPGSIVGKEGRKEMKRYIHEPVTIVGLTPNVGALGDYTEIPHSCPIER